MPGDNNFTVQSVPDRVCEVSTATMEHIGDQRGHRTQPRTRKQIVWKWDSGTNRRVQPSYFRQARHEVSTNYLLFRRAMRL